MGVTAFPNPTSYPQGHGEIALSNQGPRDWVGLAVGGSFLVGGLAAAQR